MACPLLGWRTRSRSVFSFFLGTWRCLATRVRVPPEHIVQVVVLFFLNLADSVLVELVHFDHPLVILKKVLLTTRSPIVTRTTQLAPLPLLHSTHVIAIPVVHGKALHIIHELGVRLKVIARTIFYRPLSPMLIVSLLHGRLRHRWHRVRSLAGQVRNVADLVGLLVHLDLNLYDYFAVTSFAGVVGALH